MRRRLLQVLTYAGGWLALPVVLVAVVVVVTAVVGWALVTERKDDSP